MTPQHSHETNEILSAIVYLADRCNGAVSEDGAGFNKFDSDNGLRMAQIIRSGKSLSMLDFQRAQGFFNKYQKQLSDRVHPFDKYAESIMQSPNRDGLNDQQGNAFDGLLGWYRNPYGSRQSLVVGYAGTGKTFSCQKISRELIEVDRAKICMTAFTHKACQVLSQMAKEAGLNVEVRTICNLLGLSVSAPDKKGKCKIQQKFDDKSYQYDFIWVDEGSMVGHALNEFVEDMQARYTVLGDPCQLPDVETGLGSPVFETIKTKWELTKVVRYDGAIFRRVTDIRENITAKKLPFAKYEKGVFDKFAGDYWLENLIERYKKALKIEQQDPNAIRALAWSNARVQAVNYSVRNAIYGDHALPYIVGERLVAKDMIELQHPDGDWRSGAAWKTGSNTVLMYSCDECVIVSAKRGSKMVFGATFEGWFLDVLTDMGDEATIFTPDEKEKSRIIEVCGAKKKVILDMHFEDRKRPQMWAIFYKGLNELGLKMSGDGFMRKLQYAFCMTVHQSQGSTFKTAFVDVSNICGCQDITLRNKLWYVADSRASQELYELNNF
jgi:hypothetical protein